MFVDPRNPLFSPSRVVEREIVRAVVAFNQICVLTYVECAFGTHHEAGEISVYVLGRLQILRIAILRVCERVDSQIICLDQRNLLEMRMYPILFRGVLINAAPDWIDKVLLLETQCPLYFLLRIFVACASKQKSVLRGVSIEKLVVESPAALLHVVLHVVVAFD